MNELALFAGAGGGLLGTKLLGWKPIGYVEWEPYCQAVLTQRIKDGLLEEAPIFGDIREFVKSGAAREYRGFADVVSGGFPCQPHSVAGKQLGGADPRDMWPATADVVCEVLPRIVWLENSPGLISSGYIGRVIGDLAALGYVGRYGVFSAADEGADHIRERVWILAYANTDRLQERMYVSGAGPAPDGGEHQGRAPNGISTPQDGADSERGQFALGRAAGRTRRQRQSIPWNRDWPLTSEPVLARGADGVADRLDRLKATGNGQVPAVVIRAWDELARS